MPARIGPGQLRSLQGRIEPPDTTSMPRPLKPLAFVRSFVPRRESVLVDPRPVEWSGFHEGARWQFVRVSPDTCQPRRVLGDLRIPAEVATGKPVEPLPLSVETPLSPTAVRVVGGELAWAATVRWLQGSSLSGLPAGVSAHPVGATLMAITGPGGRMMVTA
jgi:hypothetical protein